MGTHHPAAARPALDGVRPGATIAGAPAITSRSGAITGVVAGTGRTPLAGACVIATGPAGDAMAMTGRDGRYTLNPLRPGNYTLHFSDCSDPGRYLDQWSGGRLVPTAASQVAVAAGQVRDAGMAVLRTPASVLAGAGTPAVSGPSANQAAGPPRRPAAAGTSAMTAGKGAIAGLVTGRGQPLQGICVVAYPVGRGRGAFVKTAKTGRYRIGSLMPGRYIVAFYDCTRKTDWLGQWYRGVMFFGARHRPTKVPVTAGRTTRGINAKLTLGGEIDGTVRNSSGRPLAKICVEAIGRSGRRFLFGGFGRTAIDGRYTLRALIPGTYQVHFIRCGNKGNYAPVWWRHAMTQAHATKIVIKSGTVARHVSPVMPTGGAVTGTVRGGGPGGNRLRRICVIAEGHVGYSVSVTGPDGKYQILGLTTGKYRLFFRRCGNRGNYLPLRRSVKVRLGHTVSGFDAFMPLGAIATGVVTDSHGAPVAGICVELQSRHGFAGTRSRRDGTFSVNALETGSYKIRFAGGCGSSGSYAPQFYHGQTNLATANQVELTAGTTTRQLNAAMQPGASIAGLITDSAGNRPREVCVAITPVSDLQFGFFFGNIAFAFDGAYEATNLTPGLYAVNFGCFFGAGQLASQWFMAKPDSGSANFVSAPAGSVTSGVNAVLQQGGSIAGTVTNRDGKPLAGICVSAKPVGETGFSRFFGPGEAITRKDGSYVLRELPPATYVLQYSECGRDVYGSRWYKQKPTPQSATPVTLAAGGAVTGIDETLAPGGSISGRVLNTSGAPVPGTCVEAFDAATQARGFGFTDGTGSYTIAGLRSGSYQVTFSPCRRNTLQLAVAVRPTPVTVTAPATVTGVNAKLGAAGTIAGSVRGSAGKLAGACVIAVPADPGNSVAAAMTGPRGNYLLRALGAGTYHVYFGDAFCPGNAIQTAFASKWYKNQQSLATATDVTVTANATTAGINATLAASGSISGTVMHQSQAVAGECVTAFPVNPVPDPFFDQTLNPVIAVTAGDGSYSLVDLPPGQYHVEFSTGCGASGFANLWWQQATSEQTASIVKVAANGAVTGIDASLP